MLKQIRPSCVMAEYNYAKMCWAVMSYTSSFSSDSLLIVFFACVYLSHYMYAEYVYSLAHLLWCTCINYFKWSPMRPSWDQIFTLFFCPALWKFDETNEIIKHKCCVKWAIIYCIFTCVFVIFRFEFSKRKNRHRHIQV